MKYNNNTKTEVPYLIITLLLRKVPLCFAYTMNPNTPKWSFVK